MRIVAVFVCTWLLSSAAFAQGKGGPSLDPLGDRQHGEPEPAKTAASKPRPVVKKVRVKKRTVRVTHVQRPAPASKPPVAAPSPKAKPKTVTKPTAKAKAGEP